MAGTDLKRSAGKSRADPIPPSDEPVETLQGPCPAVTFQGQAALTISEHSLCVICNDLLDKQRPFVLQCIC